MVLTYVIIPYTYFQLLEELEKVTFIDDGKEIKFDSNGDMSTNYDVLLWKEIDGHMEITIMAEYDPEKGDFIFEDEEKKKEFLDLRVTFNLFHYVFFSFQYLQLKYVSARNLSCGFVFYFYRKETSLSTFHHFHAP